MVDYNTWMEIGLNRCLESGMSERERQRVFSKLAEGWSREKDQIQDMSRSEVRSNLNCP